MLEVMTGKKTSESKAQSQPSQTRSQFRSQFRSNILDRGYDLSDEHGNFLLGA